jgi:hypothetical protein
MATTNSTSKVCPECGHQFQGNGWDGIDAHWRAKHDHVMPYKEAWPLIKEAWPLIKEETYKPKRVR